MNSPAGEHCSECIVNEGCKLWPNPPEKCKKFSCAYNQVEKANINLRPDKCRVVFEKVEDTFFLGTPAEDFELTDIIKGQINSFMKEGYSVVIMTKKPMAFLVEGHTQKMLKELWRKALWQHTEQT